MSGLVKKCVGALKGKETSTKKLVSLGVLGVALLLLSNLIPSALKTGTAAEVSVQNISKPTMTVDEELLRLTVEQIEGVGKACVMITYESTEDVVYAADVRQDQGGSQKEYVLLKNGSEALIQTTYSPAVQGVAVVCQGGDNTKVQADLTQMLAVLLGISTNRITILKMQN